MNPARPLHPVTVTNADGSTETYRVSAPVEMPMIHPAPGQPETTPTVAELTADLELARVAGQDLQRQVDAAIALLCEHAGADKRHWQVAVAARANGAKR